MTQPWIIWRHWLLGLAFALLAALAIAQPAARSVSYPGDENASSLAGAPAVGAPAPDFAGETIDGKRIALSDYRGKSAVLLHVYANY